jgi:hypothetical protein
MKNIHILPTDKPSRLHYFTANKAGYYLYPNNGLVIPRNPNCINQNIYITSDEEIKEGDWFIENGININKWKMSYSFPSEMNDINKKIILTTDVDLIADGVQAIDDEFLEWFVKNPSCEEVEVEKSNLLNTSRTYLGVDKYKIIIPQEEFRKKHIVTLVGNEASDLETKIIECLKEADDKLDANDFSRLAESIIDYIDEIARSKKDS